MLALATLNTGYVMHLFECDGGAGDIGADAGGNAVVGSAGW